MFRKVCIFSSLSFNNAINVLKKCIFNTIFATLHASALFLPASAKKRGFSSSTASKLWSSYHCFQCYEFADLLVVRLWCYNGTVGNPYVEKLSFHPLYNYGATMVLLLLPSLKYCRFTSFISTILQLFYCCSLHRKTIVSPVAQPWCCNGTAVASPRRKTVVSLVVFSWCCNLSINVSFAKELLKNSCATVITRFVTVV